MKNIIIAKGIAQLKREVLEYRWGLIYIPLIISLIFIIFSAVFSYYWLFVREETLSATLTVNNIVLDFMYSNCSLMLLIYFFALVNYLSGCLYDDRKNKQILFWRSMPVSETMNVLIKVFLVMFVAPTFWLLINQIFSLLGVMIASICFSSLNGSSQITFPALGEGNVFIVPLQIYRDNLLGMLFISPFIGYLLLVSAWVKRFPMAIAFGVPMLLAFIDFLLGQLDLTIGVLPLLKLYGSLWMEIRSTFVLKEVFEFDSHLVLPLLVSLLIGGVLVSISIWLRNNRYEI